MTAPFFAAKQPQSASWLPTLALLVVGIAMGWGAHYVPLPSLSGWGAVVSTSGPRQTLVVREADDDDDARSTLFKNLQSSDVAFREWLKAKGHTLEVVDDDEKGSDGAPSKFLSPLQPFKPAGEVLVFNTGKLVSRSPLPATVAEVKALIEKAGGQ